MKTYTIHLDSTRTNWVKVDAEELLLKDGCLLFYRDGNLVYLQAAGTWDRIVLDEQIDLDRQEPQ